MTEQFASQAHNIERLTPDVASIEAKTIASIYRDVWLDTYENPENDITRDDIVNHFSDFEQIVVDWKEKLSDVNRAIWVSKKDGVVTGFCIARQDNDFNELEYIYILPQYQSGGVGQEFMKQALDWMGNSKPILLYGAAYNRKAIRFYEKFGFKLSEEEIEPKRLKNGKVLPTMKMVKMADLEY